MNFQWKTICLMFPEEKKLIESFSEQQQKKNFFCNVANLAESLFMFRILKSRS